jgi:hypothetical protein
MNWVNKKQQQNSVNLHCFQQQKKGEILGQWGNWHLCICDDCVVAIEAEIHIQSRNKGRVERKMEERENEKDAIHRVLSECERAIPLLFHFFFFFFFFFFCGEWTGFIQPPTPHAYFVHLQ